MRTAGHLVEFDSAFDRTILREFIDVKMAEFRQAVWPTGQKFAFLTGFSRSIKSVIVDGAMSCYISLERSRPHLPGNAIKFRPTQETSLPQRSVFLA